MGCRPAVARAARGAGEAVDGPQPRLDRSAGAGSRSLVVAAALREQRHGDDAHRAPRLRDRRAVGRHHHRARRPAHARPVRARRRRRGRLVPRREPTSAGTRSALLVGGSRGGRRVDRDRAAGAAHQGAVPHGDDARRSRSRCRRGPSSSRGRSARGVDPDAAIDRSASRSTPGRSYYYFALVVFVAAVPDRPQRARDGASGVCCSPSATTRTPRAPSRCAARRIKLQGFLLAGFIAGVGGAAYAHSFSGIGPSHFVAQYSIDAVVMTVVGGIGILAGPLLGVALVQGVPAFVPLESLALAASRFGAAAADPLLPRRHRPARRAAARPRHRVARPPRRRRRSTSPEAVADAAERSPRPKRRRRPKRAETRRDAASVILSRRRRPASASAASSPSTTCRSRFATARRSA